MTRLVLMCGLAGAGKSTYARKLAEQGWYRVSIDEDAWRRGFTDAAVPVEVAEEIQAAQRDSIAASLDADRDVVVDYSFWSRAQRDDYRALGRAHGAVVSVVYLRTAEEVLRRRLERRRGTHADDFTVSTDLFDRYLTGFQPPGPDETDVTVLTTDTDPG